MIQALMLPSQPRFYPTFPFSCVWNSPKFPVIFYELWRCSDNAISTDFLFFKCLFGTPHILHFTLSTSTLFSFFLVFVFKFVFKRSFLQKNKRKEKSIYRESWKLWEIIVLTDRCIIKKMISKKKKCNVNAS